MTNRDGSKSSLHKIHVLVAIGGGIAAYKVCELISQLFKKEAKVKVILTESAQKFITPLTVSTLSRHQAYTDADFWQPTHSRPLHIALGEWADLMIIAPLTANTLAKLVYGLGDNLLTNTVLASTCPIIVAPAMNTEMWLQKSVQNNWQKLGEDKRYFSLHTNTGLLACDRYGQGRMAEATEILTAIESVIITNGKRDLVGKNVLISAGSTREYLDYVRFIGNPATGKMGIALACACYYRGANVTLVAGNISHELLQYIPPIQVISVVTAQQMEKAMLSNFLQADIILMAAAVADVKPKHYFPDKLGKKSLPQSIELEYVTDIVAKLGESKKPSQKLIGFAAQTKDIVTPAMSKLIRKKLDAIVTNPIDKDNAGFGSDTNEAIFISKERKQTVIPSTSKLLLAHRILDLVINLSCG
ncbi:MAG: bifunctional phosphopantothenoylcysteine decarboxylase/phosphopantothenate--cysteine ligase CoaBC [Cyanobacteria bacterium J149]|nr:MAG: bifunctional phosphopantothenoylcysteine decarboxylase/phosphopantothenate--cysteine ligase CoaBC [Cyanobacteria bacterium J149]